MPNSFSADSVHTELERILASETFAQSDRLKRFLRFTVEQVIRGSGDKLKEYVIGVEVFDRKDAYDPRTDPIVRVEAYRLRSKLKEYYQSEGQEDLLLIVFPKGTYVPVFQIREPKPHERERLRSRGRSPANGSTIAVLPFVDLSSQKDQEHFCRGIAEEISNGLVQVEGLRVVSRASTLQFGGTHLDVREVGQKLKADTILEGSVQRAGERLRIIVQLTNVVDGCHIWSGRYDQEMKDVFAVEDEISRAVVNALRVKLEDQRGSQLVKQRTKNLAAYDLYFKGRFYQDRWVTEGWLGRSIECFRQAIAQDSNYAPAYAGLAESCSLGGFYGVLPPREIMPAAKAAATKAIEIDATLGAAHTALGVVKTLYDWDWVGARQEFEYALGMQPRDANAHFWYAHYLQSMGRLDEAIVENKQALVVDPLSPLTNLHLATAYYLNGQHSEAIEQSRRAIELDPSFAGGYWSLGLAYEQQLRYEEAVKALQKATVLSGGNPWAVGSLGHCYASSGNSDAARKILEEMQALSNSRYVSPISMAQINVALGETDRAFEWFEEAYGQRDGRLIYLSVSPLYDNLRSDPRLLELARRVGVPAPR